MRIEETASNCKLIPFIEDPSYRSIMTNPHPIFSHPQILTTISSNLPFHLPTLFSCLQVSTLWAEIITTRLWKYNPPIAALSALKASRLQEYYGRKIETLDSSTEEAELKPLAPHLSHLQYVKLYLNDPATSLLSTLSALENLRVLEVLSEDVIDIGNLPILGQKCEFLCALQISFQPLERIDWNDGHIEQFSKLQPQLRYLSLHVGEGLTIQAVKYLGRTCRGLEICKLTGVFDVPELGTADDCFFPRLRTLELDRSVVVDDDDWRERTIEVVMHHAPQLSWCYFGVTDMHYELTREVLERLSVIRGRSLKLEEMILPDESIRNYYTW